MCSNSISNVPSCQVQKNLHHSETQDRSFDYTFNQTSTNTMASSRASKLSSQEEATAIPSPEPHPKPQLLTFPPEVRDTILKYLLIQPEAINFPRKWLEQLSYAQILAIVGPRPKEPVSSWTRNLVVLTRVCKQLYFEVVAIYYSSNTFTFDSTNTRTLPHSTEQGRYYWRNHSIQGS